MGGGGLQNTPPLFQISAGKRQKMKARLVGLATTPTSRRRPVERAGWRFWSGFFCLSTAGKAAKGCARPRLPPLFPSLSFSVFPGINCRPAREQQRRCSRRSRNGDIWRSRVEQVNAFCNVCANSHFFFSFLFPFFFSAARASGPCATSSKCFPLLNF